MGNLTCSTYFYNFCWSSYIPNAFAFRGTNFWATVSAFHTVLFCRSKKTCVGGGVLEVNYSYVVPFLPQLVIFVLSEKVGRNKRNKQQYSTSALCIIQKISQYNCVVWILLRFIESANPFCMIVYIFAAEKSLCDSDVTWDSPFKLYLIETLFQN